jgi:hypothetical protein
LYFIIVYYNKNCSLVIHVSCQPGKTKTNCYQNAANGCRVIINI